MLEHHEVWLSTHPRRTKQWLEERLEDGFDIHHIDGDHGNNSPDNLILLEHQDHMNIHGLNFCRIEAGEIRKKNLAKEYERQNELGYRSGHFHKKTIKGKKYWYFFDNQTKRAIYIAPEGELDPKFDAYNNSSKGIADWKPVEPHVELNRVSRAASPKTLFATSAAGEDVAF